MAKADPSVLKPDLIGLVTSALAGHDGEVLSLSDFCELLDASVENHVVNGGPMAHLFSSSAGRLAVTGSPTKNSDDGITGGHGTRMAVVAAAARAEREEKAEVKEMTFHPRIDKNSAVIARDIPGRDGSTVRAIFGGGCWGGGLVLKLVSLVIRCSKERVVEDKCIGKAEIGCAACREAQSFTVNLFVVCETRDIRPASTFALLPTLLGSVLRAGRPCSAGRPKDPTRQIALCGIGLYHNVRDARLPFATPSCHGETGARAHCDSQPSQA